MAPLPPNNTDRWYFDYTAAGIDHTFLVRAAEGTTAAEVSTEISNLLTSIGIGFYASSFRSLRFQAKSLDFSIPATYSGSVTTWGSTTPDDTGRPTFSTLVGRSGDGRRARVSIFGFKGIASVGDYRFNVAGSTEWQDAVDQLNAAEGIWLSIGETQPTWYQYVNVGYNAYWQRKMRTN